MEINELDSFSKSFTLEMISMAAIVYMNIKKLKKLRAQTDISLTECKKALEEAGGNLKEAKEILKKRWISLAEKKVGRETKEGIIEAYIHSDRKTGVLLDLRSETDFVAHSDEFQKLAHELCLQIAATAPRDKEDLLSQPWIKDEEKTIKDLISQNIAKLGENIRIERFVRMEI